MIETAPPAGYAAARHGAALVSRADRAWIVVSGKDRGSYLHGLLTNDIATLAAGRGCYAAYLTPQGRMITDLWIYELGDVILLSLSRDVKDTVLAKLDQFIFSEDVQLGDVTDSFAATAMVGPQAAARLAGALGLDEQELAALPLHSSRRHDWQGVTTILLRTSDLGEPGFDVLVDAGHADRLRSALVASGAAEIDESTATAIRVEAGVPKFHRDMDEETIPLEAGIEGRAISLTKGCYVGQEVIIRVLHRGHGRVARKLAGLLFDEGASVDAGAKVHVDGRDLGEVTSAAFSPTLDRPIALAYLHRDFLEPGTRVSVGDRHAVVHALPFIAPAAPNP